MTNKKYKGNKNFLNDKKFQMKKLMIICFCLMSSAFSNGQIKLPQIIRDSMILQRDSKINIWGWASKGEKVTVKFNNKTYRTTAGSDGTWKVQ
jgi:sialate O-acetylesterase